MVPNSAQWHLNTHQVAELSRECKEFPQEICKRNFWKKKSWEKVLESNWKLFYLHQRGWAHLINRTLDTSLYSTKHHNSLFGLPSLTHMVAVLLGLPHCFTVEKLRPPPPPLPHYTSARFTQAEKPWKKTASKMGEGWRRDMDKKKRRSEREGQRGVWKEPESAPIEADACAGSPDQWESRCHALGCQWMGSAFSFRATSRDDEKLDTGMDITNEESNSWKDNCGWH